MVVGRCCATDVLPMDPSIVSMLGAATPPLQISVSSAEYGATLHLVRTRLGSMLAGCLGTALRLELALEKSEAVMGAREAEVGMGGGDESWARERPRWGWEGRRGQQSQALEDVRFIKKTRGRWWGRRHSSFGMAASATF